MEKVIHLLGHRALSLRSIVIALILSSFLPNISNGQLLIKDFAVWGGDGNCPSGPGQTPPGGTGCSVFIGAGSTVNGNVGSYNFVGMNGGAKVNGNIFAGQRVQFANGNAVNDVTVANFAGVATTVFSAGASTDVFGDINSNGRVHINKNGSFVLGDINTGAYPYSGPSEPASGNPAIVPIFPVMPTINAFSCANPEAIPAKVNNVVTVLPGHTYGNLISDNSPLTIRFEGPGTYIFNSINLGQGGKHYIIYDFNGLAGDINVYVCGNVNMGNIDASFDGPATEDACRINWETHGIGNGSNKHSFIIGAGSHFFGQVWAPYSSIHVGSGSCCTFVTGNLWSGTQVDIEHGVTVNTCEECTGDIHITKHVVLDCPDDQDVETFHFTVTKNGNPFTTFDLNVSFGVDDTKHLMDLGPGTYVVTETPDPDWAPSTSCADCSATTANSMTFVIVGCESKSGTFNNTNTACQGNECQWCNKGAVLSQVWQNPGCDNEANKCVVPDILVDIDMPHGGANDVVDASEVRTSEPATWSIQAAVDFILNPANIALFPSPCGELFIGVVGEDPIPVNPADPTSCGKSCAYPLSGDTPIGVENVVINNTTTRRLNIFGCSVTMTPANPILPVFHVIRNNNASSGKVTILDLHVVTENPVNGVAGYLVTGHATNGGRFTLKNSRAKGFDIGYDIRVNDVEITGSPSIRGNRIGVNIVGNSNILRTNNEIWDNTDVGVKIAGNSNELNGNDIGSDGHPNGVGVLVNGNSSNIHDNEIHGNTGDGVNVTGNTNTIKGNDIGDENDPGATPPEIFGNGGDGVQVSGDGNIIEQNDIFGNSGNGIYVSGGSNNIVKGNKAGDEDKGNKLNGILISDTGNGTAAEIEIEGNTTRDNGTLGVLTDGVGIKVTGTGHQLKNNISGGNAGQNNENCEFDVVAGNFNATGNKANGVTIAGANGTAFPTTCQGSARGVQDDVTVRTITRFGLFPNPAKNKITIEFISATTSDYTLSVLDISGRVIHTESYLAQVGANVREIELTKVSSGVYVMSIKNGEEKFLKKFIVQ